MYVYMDVKSLHQKQSQETHTLFLQHAVGFLYLGLVFKPQSPAVEDLCHPVFDRLWRPRAKVLFRKTDRVSATARMIAQFRVRAAE